jgi:putative ABC transport system permease protein
VEESAGFGLEYQFFYMNENYEPPKRFAQWFGWFCADEYYEELQGDLEEAFYENVALVGIRKARQIYRLEVLKMLRPSVIKKLTGQNINSNNIEMIRNYLKIAFRNMLGQKAYSFINIFGLAVGMAATILISLYVQDELSYDRYHEKSDQIYRVSREWLNQDGESSLHLGHVAAPFAPFLKNDFEGVVLNAVRINSGGSPLIVYGDKRFEESNFFFADADVFEVFTWKFRQGDPKTALTEPNTIVITQSIAEKYFGNTDAMGQMLSYNDFGLTQEMKITGVIEDIPHNSHFKVDFIASFHIVELFFGGHEELMRNWGGNNYSTFIVVPEGYNIAELEAQIPAFIDKHLMPNKDGTLVSATNKLHFMPLTDIHLYSHLDSEIEANGDISYVYTYTVIALFILIIACINFMNLSTARSIKRAREVGVRKVMGAYRSSLIQQFITESVLVAFISIVIAIGFVFMVLPGFNHFADKQLSLFGSDPVFLIALLAVVVVIVGLIAGSYPAFYLSSFQPVSVLKGAFKAKSGGFNLRSLLVVFQFFISICLIIGVGIIGNQIDYMKTKNLGFDKENLWVLPSNDQIHNDFKAIKARLLEQPGIAEVTFSSRVPSGRLLDSQGGMAEIDKEMKNISFRIADIHVDHDYLNSLKVKILAGRNFDVNLASDSSEAFILNKSATDGIGWRNPEEAIGKKFNYGGRQGYVVGVVDDFHFESLHQTIAPMVFVITNGRARNVIVKVKSGYEAETLKYLTGQWTYLRPGYEFDYYTISDRFNEQYVAEEKLGLLVRNFSLLAIFIAILGLFGLSSFSIQQRTREIGIRKVMGAPISGLLMLLSRKFTGLVLIGLLLAIPVTYYGMEQWLAGFPYAEQISVWPFVTGGLFALIFAIITVSFEIIKAASANPVDAIRNE